VQDVAQFMSQNAFEFRPGRVPGVNPAGIIPWIVSSGVGIYLIASNNPIASTWALVITFVLSVLISAGLLLASKDRWHALIRAHDPRDEVENVAHEMSHPCPTQIKAA